VRNQSRAGLALGGFDASARQADCAVIITDHADFDYQGLLDSAKVIVDTRNAMRGVESEKIVRL